MSVQDKPDLTVLQKITRMFNPFPNPSATDKAPVEKAEKAEKKPRAPRRRKSEDEAKPVDLAASGLQLVETKSDAKAAVSTAAPEAEKAPKSRKPAAWQQKAAADAPAAEPLVMVETQK